MSQFLEIHVIQSLPPSNVNRDDTGSPKSAIYGGTNRLRVSSQAWKRATRLDFEHEIAEVQRATRTKRIVSLLAERITQLGGAANTAIQRAATTLEAAGIKTTAPKAKKGQETKAADPQAEALVFVSNQQLERLALLANQTGDIDKKAARLAIDTHHGIEVALFGRMVASSPDLNVDAAVQVAHAISTHTVDLQGDFYTAVDDVKQGQEDEDSGAGMMGTLEFASATMYRYAAISLDLLSINLGDDAVVPEAIAAFLRSFCMSLPSGKKNSFAADTIPSLVHVVLRDGRPVSLVGAFERPVRNSEDGYVAASVERLGEQATEVQQTFAVVPTRSWVVAESSLLPLVGPLGDHVAFGALLDQVREATSPDGSAQ